MDPRVKVSAAGGVLRVENAAPLDVAVSLEGRTARATVSPGSMKEFALPAGGKYEVGAAEDPEATAPPIPAAGVADVPRGSESLIGSNLQPAEFPDILVLGMPASGQPIEENVILSRILTEDEKQDFRVLTLGDVVADAHARARSGDRTITAAEWNELEQNERERLIAETLDILTEAATRAAGEPPPQ